jgi:hypothetical protein
MRDSSRYGHELEQGSAMSELPSRADIIGRVLRVLKVPISNILYWLETGLAGGPVTESRN